jgi:hypothetical protein
VLDWDHLKAKVRGTGAEVKLTVVDACSASGVLKASGKISDEFALAAEDHLTVEGEAWITSSSEREPSVEAGAWRGSVFTHHLVAGLRGAADRNGDRKVSLEELYRYAFDRTVTGQSGQHPGYAFRLAGYGDLFVSDLSRAPAVVTLPPGLDAVTVTDRGSGDVLAEVRHPMSRLLALGAGRVDLRLLRGDQAYLGHLDLGAGDRVTLDEAKLDRVTAPASSPCLDVSVLRPDPRLEQLKARLEGPTEKKGRCEQPQKATLSREKGRLKLTLSDRVYDAESDEELLKALGMLNL